MEEKYILLNTIRFFPLYSSKIRNTNYISKNIDKKNVFTKTFHIQI